MQELSLVMEEISLELTPRGRARRRTGARALAGQCCGACVFSLHYFVTLVVLLAVLLWLLPAAIMQAVGMLVLMMVMPSVMRTVYPSRLGALHLVAFRLLRKLTLGEDGHSRSIRVDLLAYRNSSLRAKAQGERSTSEACSSSCSRVRVGAERNGKINGAGSSVCAHGATAAAGSTGGGDTGCGGGGGGGGSGGSSGGGRSDVGSGAAGAGPSVGCAQSRVEQRRGKGCVAGVGLRGGDDASAHARDGDAVQEMVKYSVHTVACLLDNYCYIIVDRSSPPPHPFALVDPCEPRAVLRALQRLSVEEYGGAALQPTAILTTHHHWDHAGGNESLKRTLGPGLAVYGGERDGVAGCTHPLRDGDKLRVGRLTVHALNVPGHTRGSMAYLIRGPTPSAFGGDLLFCGGCGAPFEGTQEQMARSFAKLWRHCPANTRLFPGHEYTLAILPQYISGSMPTPDKPKLYGKLCAAIWRAKQLRAQEPPIPTVPLLLADELMLNVNFAPLRQAAEHLVQAWRLYNPNGALGGLTSIPALGELACRPCEPDAGASTASNASVVAVAASTASTAAAPTKDTHVELAVVRPPRLGNGVIFGAAPVSIGTAANAPTHTTAPTSSNAATRLAAQPATQASAHASMRAGAATSAVAGDGRSASRSNLNGADAVTSSLASAVSSTSGLVGSGRGERPRGEGGGGGEAAGDTGDGANGGGGGGSGGGGSGSGSSVAGGACGPGVLALGLSSGATRVVGGSCESSGRFSGADEMAESARRDGSFRSSGSVSRHRRRGTAVVLGDCGDCSGGAHCGGAGGACAGAFARVAAPSALDFVMVEREELRALDDALARGSIREARRTLEVLGELCDAEAEIGGVVVHHASLPPASDGISGELVTQLETQSAFALLECAPGRVQRGTLLRLLASTQLADSPLSPEQAALVLESVGSDSHGLVSLDRFNERLCVLPPPLRQPPRQNCCVRLAKRLCSTARKQDIMYQRRYELGDSLSE